MLRRLILKVTKSQLPAPKRFSTVVKTFFSGEGGGRGRGGGGGGGGRACPCQTELKFESLILVRA